MKTIFLSFVLFISFFATAPAAGTQNFKFFPGATTQAYAPAFISLTGAPGRTAIYDSSISTLIVS